MTITAYIPPAVPVLKLKAEVTTPYIKDANGFPILDADGNPQPDLEAAPYLKLTCKMHGSMWVEGVGRVQGDFDADIDAEELGDYLVNAGIARMSGDMSETVRERFFGNVTPKLQTVSKRTRERMAAFAAEQAAAKAKAAAVADAAGDDEVAVE